MTIPVRVGNIIPGDIVSFSIAGSLLRTVNDALVVAVTTGSYIRNSTAAATNHANLRFNFAGEDFVDDFTGYNYVTVRVEDGTLREIGMPWIIPETLSFSSNVGAEYTVTGISSTDSVFLLNNLNRNGFNVIKSENSNGETLILIIRYTPVNQTEEVDNILNNLGHTYTRIALG